ncbi:acyl-CoA oxidase [Culex quinquefasciatus]|uniref:Acyl-coenzyme A oxidase n=2 Tax=Culex pipiens complex TaxID=518105 RepID=B0W6W3_CULQU|nr:probable peroxisomal acyl-coenzyme A oxidase 1 [Culex quinquefasciatus]EDS37109.1 acyl-CoA oxidase [Culex quinquefasciatus]|eukprot:XP_001844447.1 acyl-CoA oxidase [Culex quinquefasciatus]
MPSTTSVVNKDLLDERSKCTFDREEFSVWWVGGKDRLDEKRNREHFCMNQPEFGDKIPLHYLSHKELYEETIRKATTIFAKSKEMVQKKHGYNAGNFVKFLDVLTGDGFMHQANPLAVHFSMFVPGIMGHGNAEQQERWLDRALNCKILGTYVQTELGHGTFLRGLETTATFDEETDEIVINSPRLSAYKWWPGGLGLTANHCIVMAQLYSKGRCHGVNPFMVQIRDEETHMPLAGIEIGEIGNKLGYNGVNNGFLGFKNFRIPRSNMLMKNAKLLRDGTYQKPISSVLNYGTMVFTRVLIVLDTSQMLARAATIAVRYSCVRRQSVIDPNKPEVQVIDHQTQQGKLLPQLAKAIALKLSADNLWKMYEATQVDLETGNTDRLPELHAVSCCLKAVSTGDAAAGVEVCRLACGGHGYLSSTNFLNLYGSATAAVTYEGENTVLYLQTARYLVKVWNQALKGQQLMPTVRYLEQYATKPVKRFAWSDSTPVIIEAFQAVTANRLRLANEHIQQRVKAGRTPQEATNETGLELVRLAEIHCRGFILQSAYAAIEQACQTASQPLGEVLREICRLVVYDEALRITGDLLMFTTMSDPDLVELQRKYEVSLGAIRPNAVSIVDAFDYPDFILGSTLGAYDGNVYERLFEDAMKSPLNQEPVNRTFELYLKPLMRGKL